MHEIYMSLVNYLIFDANPSWNSNNIIPFTYG
jgi:hypothetical protein